MSPTELARLLEQFFADHPHAALLEDGRVLFEMTAAHYSISAEHGIGSLKRDFLHLSRSPEEIALMRTIKQAMDPNGILNPGKIF